MEDRTERIAAGVEIIEQNNKFFWVTGGRAFVEYEGSHSFEAAVQAAAEYHASANQNKVMGDPMRYVEGAAEKF